MERRGNVETVRGWAKAPPRSAREIGGATRCIWIAGVAAAMNCLLPVCVETHTAGRRTGGSEEETGQFDAVRCCSAARLRRLSSPTKKSNLLACCGSV